DDADADADERADLAKLCAAHIDAAYAFFAKLVGDPGLLGPAGEGVADAPDHLRQQDGDENRERAFEHEPEADQDDADDDRAPPAIDVGDDSGRDLEQQR